tara:strand:- start:139 stop:828 length:690 start_codon:yes stop_codon:yes gene_type:complete
MTTATKLKISKQTIELLKNFASINSNILVRPGNKIKTISNYKNVLAEATVEESFDIEFGIWDLNKFLGTISLFESPTFEFNQKNVIIEGENGATVVYYYSEPKLLTTVNKELKMPEAVVQCEIKEEDFKEIQRAAGVLQLPDLKISSEGDKINLTVHDRKDPSSNSWTFEVGDNTEDADFSFLFKVENMKMLSGDYNIEICKNSVAKFNNKAIDLSYWVAMEPDSTYNA